MSWGQFRGEENYKGGGRLGQFSSVQFSTQSCLTLCDPMDCSMPGLPVHHQLLDLAQTHVLRVGDTIQPSHPLLSLSPPRSVGAEVRQIELKRKQPQMHGFFSLGVPQP